MKVGDLVTDKYFKQYGIVTSKPFRKEKSFKKELGHRYCEYVWVLFHNGSHTKYKVNYLEVVNEGM